MRVLHTSDWHLGQKFHGRSRDDEHRLALAWMLQLIEDERVDCLIVAGDIFDTANPPTSAEALYYEFLSQLLRSKSCRHVVITGGNHDQPARLNAPRGLMRALGMHVVGCATGDPQDEILVLKNASGEAELVVAAVPFLRPSDLPTGAMGESAEARIARMKEGIAAHYAAVGELCQPFAEQKLPIIATGHLYAKGAEAAAEQANIYLGNLDNIAADQFPAVFEYVALGHIHRPQIVGRQPRIRYSGSPIPLSFSEISDKKSVVLLDFEAGRGLVSQKLVEVPVVRRLVKISGTMPEVVGKIEALAKKIGPDELPAWLETSVKTGGATGIGLDDEIREACLGLPVENLLTRLEKPPKTGETTAEPVLLSLDELSPMAVFMKKIGGAEDGEELAATFRELLEGE